MGGGWSVNPSGSSASRASLNIFELLQNEDSGPLWSMMDIGYGLQGFGFPQWLSLAKPGAITQATLYAAMGLHKLIPKNIDLPNHIALKRGPPKGPAL